ncbi:hypothetical protein [Mycoplasma sp. 4404]|uniref:hypothetical protein n=1 Tax=Mycoplasma sp. 4404 TaxID=3108530 RepID=UPI002B1DB2A4|nr:hypothetical protein [Mycoplasma sp. 4404]MEA4162629.1 hypothetical protein [Mycoplasma sp. 4404]
MKKLDTEFYKLISIFNSIFKTFENENKKLNFHLSNNKLFYINRENIYHIIGMHYISNALGYSKKQDNIKKIRRFIDDILNQKLNYYKLQQSFRKNIKSLITAKYLKNNPNAFFKLIVERIETFVEICTKDFENEEEIMIGKLPNEDITYLCVKKFSKDLYGTIGFKKITRNGYYYDTYISQTIKTINKKHMTFEIEKFKYRTFNLKTK